MSTTPSPMRALYGESSTTTTTPMPVSMSGYMSTTTTTPTPGECCTPTVLAKYGPNDIIPAGPEKGKLFRIGFPGWQAGDWWWGDKDNNIFTENNIDLNKPPTPLIVSTWRGCFKLNPKLSENGIPDNLANIQPGPDKRFSFDLGLVTRLLWVKCECCPEKDWRPVSKPPPPAKPTEPKLTEPKPTEPKPTEPKPGDEDKPIDTKPGGGAGPSDDEMERKRLEEEEDKRFEDRKRKAEEEDRKREEMETRPAPRPDDVIPGKDAPGLGIVPRGGCCTPQTYWWVCPPANVEVNIFSPTLRRVVPVRDQIWCDNWLASLAASSRFPTAGQQNAVGNTGYSNEQFNDDRANLNLTGMVVGWCVDAEWRQNQAGRVDKKGIVPNLGKVKVHDLKKCKCFRVRPGKEADVKNWFFVPPTAAGGTYNYKGRKSPSGPSMWEECKCCPGWQGKVTKFRRMGVNRTGKPGGAPREEIIWLVRKDFKPDGVGEFTRARNKFWCPPPW